MESIIAAQNSATVVFPRAAIMCLAYNSARTSLTVGNRQLATLGASNRIACLACSCAFLIWRYLICLDSIAFGECVSLLEVCSQAHRCASRVARSAMKPVPHE